MPTLPALSIRSAQQNALAALARGDKPEFDRLTLDLAGLLDRTDDVEGVRNELRRRAFARRDAAAALRDLLPVDRLAILLIVELDGVPGGLAELIRALLAQLPPGEWDALWDEGASRTQEPASEPREAPTCIDAQRAARAAYDEARRQDRRSEPEAPESGGGAPR